MENGESPLELRVPAGGGVPETLLQQRCEVCPAACRTRLPPTFHEEREADLFSEALEGALGANVRLEEALGSRSYTPDLGKLVTVQKPSSFGGSNFSTG